MSAGQAKRGAARIRLALAMALLGLGGCSGLQDRHLAASWYLVDQAQPKPVPGVEPDLSEVVATVDDIYLAIVNRGPRARKLYALLMNGEELASFDSLPRPNGYYEIVPGQVLLLETGIFRNGSPCRLPVRVAIRTKDSEHGHPRPIRLIGTMPDALPSEWLERCRK